jgi:hypothetical protein
MDEALVALASAAGSTLVKLMATDEWQSSETNDLQ